MISRSQVPSRLDDEDEDEPRKSTPHSNPVNELEMKLLSQRRVLVFGEVNDRLARDVVARLLFLANESDKPIDVYVNSPGGHVESGDSIHDMIRYVDVLAPVRVIGTGWVASAGATIFLGAAKERRLCLPNTRFLLHQPLGGIRGRAGDIAIEAREIVKIRERVNRLIARETGQAYEKVEQDTQSNYWMSAEEAVAYGMVSRIIQTARDL